MSLNFKFIPLTFIKEEDEILKQIRNTIILRYFFDKNESVVKLSHLIEGTQYGYNASALQSGKNKFLRISDITNGKVDWNTVPYCDCDDENTYLLNSDDLLIARTGGTTGKSFLITSPPDKAIFAGYLIRIRANKKCNAEFLNLFLNSYTYWSQIVSLNADEFRPSVNANKLQELILPVCNLQQQLDAVKIANGQLLAGYADLKVQIDNALHEYRICKDILVNCELQKSNTDLLKQSILQEAIQGKLTEDWRRLHPELVEGEPASELLKRIEAEKAKLIKEGKVKKEKPLPPIAENEIPFELPEGWVWCRLNDIITLLGDGLHGTPVFSDTGEYFFINGNNLVNGVIEIKPNTKRIDETEYLKYKKTLTANSLLVSINGSLGNIAFYNNENIILGKSACYFNLIDGSWKHYLKRIIESRYFLQYAISESSKTTINNLSLKNMRLLPIPLPPLEEQKAIVQQVESLMEKCRALEAEITQSEQHAQMLMQAVLKEAFEPKLKETKSVSPAYQTEEKMNMAAEPEGN